MISSKINRFVFFLIIVTTLLGVLFNPIFKGYTPIPADTIVGLYHPWRDVVWNGLVSGVPYKNFLTTDPVRQQYPWRELAIEKIKNFELPLWNPYAFSGTVLLGNHQSAPFYPLNIVFLILPFSLAWTLLVILQPILQIIGMALYLRNKKISLPISVFGGVIWAFSGFSVAWMMWNTVVHAILWLPFILLCIDKIIFSTSRIEISNIQLKNKKLIWPSLLTFSLCSSFFAGHLQSFFYVAVFSFVYTLLQITKIKNDKKGLFFIFAVCTLLVVLITSIQWIPTINFILLSARDIQRTYWTQPGWFLPPAHLLQFIAPDFFGNPTTLNYWGVWNYGEFVGYISILPLFFSLSALFYKQSKSTIFFGGSSLLFLLLMLPTPLASLPYILRIPFISTSQPTRLMGMLDFCLVVLAAYGIEQFLARPLAFLKKQILMPFVLLVSIFSLLWVSVLIRFSQVPTQYWSVAQKNLLLPSVIFLVFVGVFVLLQLFGLGNKKAIKTSFIIFICILTVGDLGRFMWKFVSFSNNAWIFPKTKIISYLQSQPGPFRFMSTDSRLFPPNFSTHYKIQTVDGYDPLYLSTYGEFVGAWIREAPDVSAFNFNRIITPQNYESKFADLANVKYVLSLKDESSPKLKLVMKEGETRLYENIQVFPRAYLVENIETYQSKTSLIEAMFDTTKDLSKIAFLLESAKITAKPLSINEYVKVVSYKENTVELKSSTNQSRFLVLTDTYYPSWHASVDEKEVKVYKTNYTFRGVVVPEGEHTIKFAMKLL